MGDVCELQQHYDLSNFLASSSGLFSKETGSFGDFLTRQWGKLIASISKVLPPRTSLYWLS